MALQLKSTMLAACLATLCCSSAGWLLVWLSCE